MAGKSADRELAFPRKATLAIGILSIVLGLVAIASGIVFSYFYFANGSGDVVILLLGIAYVLAGIATTLWGILVGMLHHRKSGRMLVFSYLIITFWSIFLAITSIMSSLLLELLGHTMGGDELTGLIFYSAVIDTFVYAASAFALIVALVLVCKREGQFRIPGIIGSVILAGGAIFALCFLLAQYSPLGLLFIAVDALLFVNSILLIVISAKSKEVENPSKSGQ